MHKQGNWNEFRKSPRFRQEKALSDCITSRATDSHTSCKTALQEDHRKQTIENFGSKEEDNEAGHLPGKDGIDMKRIYTNRLRSSIPESNPVIPTRKIPPRILPAEVRDPEGSPEGSQFSGIG
ncbi:unnamed protein product [Strongylus vulgaris]|uniref:Uncharacterized protein n=1 Tax=Strongylus vulgaris TaxID=40348 RepID=A0A3P7LPP5_STRVU|nr:unnamed protein product [Strongylus vulgaris]